MDYSYHTIALRGRRENSISLVEDKSIVITTDILKHNTNKPNTTITLDDVSKQIDALADTINLYSNNPPGDITPQSMVYGERLVEILKWLIETMVTHSHPPNAPAINTFHDKATEYHSNMDTYILNHNIKTK